MSCVVILPIHKKELNPNEYNSILYNLKILKNWDHAILCPNGIREDIKKLFSSSTISKNIKFIGLHERNFKSVTTYDQMLVKPYLYNMFKEYEYMLITQPDVIIFKDEIQYWIEKDIDYIGAPWIIECPDHNYNFYVGNGGISLRKISSFIEALANFKILKCPNWYLKEKKIPAIFRPLLKFCFGFNRFLFFSKTHEDFFWSQLIPSSNNSFKVAKVDEAFSFAIEKFREIDKKRFSINNTPFALHAWEKHAPKEIKEDIQKLIG